MENKIESNYVINIDDVLKNLRTVSDTLGNVEDVINRTGRNPSFDVLAKKVENYNRVLADGQSIYRRIEGGAKAYKEEVERLQKSERDLVKTQAEFKDSLSYDEAEKNLQAVRKRLQELNAELVNTEKTGEKAGNKVTSIFGGMGGVIKTAGLAIAGFFALDKLSDFEGQIVEATKNYQKYFAVLKNGFGDENKATDALEMIYNFASATPFAVNEITESFIKLNNRGITPTQEELTKLGDLSASQGKSLNQLTEALLDGMSGEFERLKEFGIRAKTVGDNVTLTFKGVDVTVNKFNEGALKDAILGFGEMKGVTGSMATVSLTLEGSISNLGDSYDQLLVSLGKSQGFLGSVVGLFKDLLDGVKAFVDVPLEQKLTRENSELNVLAGSLILVGDNQALRSKLMTEISQKYPSFLALLGKESDNNYAIENALKLVNEQYRIKIKLAGQDVLAKRNAEKLADVYESQADAYAKAEAKLKSYGYTASQFQQMSAKQQESVLQDIKNRTKDTKISGGGFGGMVVEGGLKEKAIEPFKEILRLTALQSTEEDKGIAIQKRKLDLENESVEARNKAVERMKQENEGLKKNLITQKEYNELSKVSYLSDGDKASMEKFKKFQANKEEITTFTKQGETPAPAGKDSGNNGNKPAKQTLKDTKDELQKLIDEQEKYLNTIYKIKLESENVRLSLLDKSSKDYLDKKRIYDLGIIEQERNTFLEIYKTQLANQLLKDELEKRGNKISQDELKSLKQITKEKAEVLANGTGPDGFANAEGTQSQRSLLLAKRAVIDFNYNREIKTLEDKSNKEQLDRLEQHTQLIGEGLEKEIITIQNKYNKLIETYEKDLNLVRELEIKRNSEIEKTRLLAGDKAIDTASGIEKKTVQDRVLPSGGNQLQFEARNKRDLLELDIAFYAEKYRLLKEYLSSAQFEQAEANGLISKEEKQTYQERLDTYQKGLQNSNDSLDKFVKSSESIGVKFKDNWDVIGEVFKSITGDVLKFSENPEINQKIKDDIDQSLGAIKDGFSMILQAQIESANNRISALDSEISERQSKVNVEFENYKQGYANNYLEEKKNLDLKKKERESEIENKKKLQKEQAIIDSISIISTNAVTVANMISAASEAFKAHAGIPFLGIAIALGAVATIVATVAGISAKAKQATRMRYGGAISGNLHESGGVRIGNTDIEVEGGEFVTRREQYSKKPSFFEAINDNTFGGKTLREQHELLKPFGMKLAEGRDRILIADTQQKQRRDKAQDENLAFNRQFGLIADGLKEVASNTANISEFNYVQSGEETLKFNKKGNIVEIIKKS